MFWYMVLGIAGWALEGNHSEPSTGFIACAGSSNPEINVGVMDFTNVFKVR